MRTILVVATVIALAVGVGVVAESVSATARGGLRIIVTRHKETVPAACRGPRGVARLLIQFDDAFNRGDTRRLARFFGSDFDGYVVTDADPQAGGRFSQFRKVKPLLRYFARRHAHGERRQLVMVEVGKQDPLFLPHEAAIAFWLMREAGDLDEFGINHPVAGGKGTLNCRTKHLTRIAIGMATEPPVPAPYWPYLNECPRPRDWNPTEAVVACS